MPAALGRVELGLRQGVAADALHAVEGRGAGVHEAVAAGEQRLEAPVSAGVEDDAVEVEAALLGQVGGHLLAVEREDLRVLVLLLQVLDVAATAA